MMGPTGTLADAYDILAATSQYILCRSRAANPNYTYAIQRVDSDGRPYDLQLKTDRVSAERAWCALCFPWFE